MWYIPPPQPGASRADREWHRREVEATEREIKVIWSNACAVAHLAPRLSPPYPYRVAPSIGWITLDSAPAGFSIKLRDGQLLSDLVANKERLAAAYRVPTVEFERLSEVDPQWILISLVEPIFEEQNDDLEPAPIASVEAQAGVPADPRERRSDRDRVGGPRSFSRGRHRTTRSASHRPRHPEGRGPGTASSVLRRLLPAMVAVVVAAAGAITGALGLVPL